MNKNLEKEYRELMTEEVPDLWDRIEAELEPGKSSANGAGLWRKYRVWGTAAAACVCLAAVITLLFGQSGDRYSGSSPSMNGGDYGEYSGAASGEDVAYESSSTDTASSSSASAAESAADSVSTCIMIGVVTETAETDDRKEFAVEIAEADTAELSKGDLVWLYADHDLEMEIAPGEEYLFDVLLLFGDDGEAEYWIMDAF